MDLLKAMQVFVAVTEEGSFSGAARALNLAPAVVTRLVAQLEEHLDARLINRTTRSLAVTEVGAAYLERARVIFSDLAEAERLTRADVNDSSGPLRVTAPSTLLSHQLARHLPEFRERFPKVQLNLQVARQPDAIDDAADITLMVAPTDSLDGSFVARPLARSTLMFCATPDYLARHGRPRHPRDLHEHELLVMNDGPRHWAFDAPGRRGGEPVVFRGQRAQGLDTTHYETLFEAAIAGMGIVPTLSYIADRALASGELEQVLPDWPLATSYTVWAGMPSRKHQPARARAFVDYLVEQFGGGLIDPWYVPPRHALLCAAA